MQAQHAHVSLAHRALKVDVAAADTQIRKDDG